jgi:hypothetical protein
VHYLGEKDVLELTQNLGSQKVKGLMYLIHNMKLKPLPKKPGKKSQPKGKKPTRGKIKAAARK